MVYSIKRGIENAKFHRDISSISERENLMSWATQHITRLQKGETVQFRPKGGSMSGKIESGQLVTVQPVSDLEIGDIVLCKVGGATYLHLVKANQKDEYLIGNNRGGINGWTKLKNIYGKVVKIEK